VKQFIKIALLVFYVFFNAGLGYSMHYCGEDFQHINLFGETKTCCPSEEPMPGCCDDVSNLELPNSDQQHSEIIDFQPIGFDYIIPTFQFELPASVFGISEKTAFSDSSPPIFHNTPIYIFCQVFLI
jgi:hypothetical protein